MSDYNASYRVSYDDHGVYLDKFRFSIRPGEFDIRLSMLLIQGFVQRDFKHFKSSSISTNVAYR